MSLAYRPEIDGLRAVAVVPVILFHAGVDAFPGGYVGVDVFFVISGYLITALIYREMMTGRFSLLRFYERRARRILPALLIVCALCIPFAWWWLLPDDFEVFSQSLIATNLFVSNIYFWRSIGYFTAPAEMTVLLHTWSLAVEEQFYLLFPLGLMMLHRLSRYVLFGIMLLVFLASLALAEWGIANHHVMASFYLLPTRAWEFMAGAMAALLLHEGRRPSLGRWNGVAALLGVAMILIAVLAFNEEVRTPGVLTLVPVLGTCLVILFAGRDDPAGRLLSLRPVVGIGLISYSAYLFHQPVLVFARERLMQPLTPWTTVGLCLLILVLSVLSWRFVEQPVRNRQLVGLRQVVQGSVVATLALVTFGFYSSMTHGIPGRMAPEVVAIAAEKHKTYDRARGCQVNPGQRLSIDTLCAFHGDSDQLVAVWGDSHATPLVRGLAKELVRHGYGVKQLVHTNCLPFVGYQRSDGRLSCTQFNEMVLDYLIYDDEIEYVVMMGRFPMQLTGEMFDNNEGGVELGQPVKALPLDSFDGDQDRIALLREGAISTIQALIDSGKKVVLVYPVPEMGWDVPKYIAKSKLYETPIERPVSTSQEIFLQRVGTSYEFLDSLGENKALVRVKPESLFCNTHLEARCVAELDGELLYYDDSHLSSLGSKLLVRNILTRMQARGWSLGVRLAKGRIAEAMPIGD
ncbi:acyltransferase family protein [Halomonas sp. C05BenzN]|uniref:acyltransferase family protein n=1 Tax=Halomonas sp. C05BenzN TaxID=3411041 RepID=UPI003B95C271